jgi:hypothetical protein
LKSQKQAEKQQLALGTELIGSLQKKRHIRDILAGTIFSVMLMTLL